MQSRYRHEDARALVAQYGDAYGEDLALRVYTSRLLGQDPSLVLHGGGNTSVKSCATTLLGDEVDVLFVKGSGWDLGAIEPRGFPACRLSHLRRLCALTALTDEQMVSELRGQMLDPSSPTPSVEALLHAYLPAKFVDHTHADAVLALVDQPGSEQLVREVYGDDVLFVPYVMPGFVLARRVAELFGARAALGAPPTAMILDKHGIFTWGDTAEESYERMIAQVALAEARVGRAREPVTAKPVGATVALRAVPLVRGALGRASQKGFIARLRATDAVLALAERPDAAELTARGPVTPDHVIRTKGVPLVTKRAEELDAASLDAAFEDYATRYHAYFERCSAARGVTKTELDPWPRVVLVPGLGAMTLGRTAAEADVVGDVFEHTAEVVLAASALGTFTPVSELDRFDVEYWSLEQAKLGKPAPEAPLDRRVALVTGGASGIGLATARAMLAAGAHVVLADRDAGRLEAAAKPLGERFRGRVVHRPCDVGSDEDVRAAIEASVRAFGGLDVVVSNAGAAFTGALHEASGERALLASLELNLVAHQRVARAATSVMLAQGTGGALLFNASKSAFNQGPDFGPYAVAKSALVSLVRQYAVDLGARGIRANAVNADRIRTGLFGAGVLEARAKARGVAVDEYFRANLLRRETTADDVAEAFVYLATAEATTGCVVTVDGGNAAAFPR